VPVGKPHSQYFSLDFTKAEVPLFLGCAMLVIDGNDAVGIKKGMLRIRERDTVFFTVDLVFFSIPLKVHSASI